MTKQQFIRRITECIESHLNEVSTETVAKVLANSDRENQKSRVLQKLAKQLNDKYKFVYDDFKYYITIDADDELVINIIDIQGGNTLAGQMTSDGIIIKSPLRAALERVVRNLPAGPRKKLQSMISEIKKFKENYQKTEK